MAKICCFIQRQNNDVIAIVPKDHNGTYDFINSRLITGSIPDQDLDNEICSFLKETTNFDAEYALQLLNHDGTFVYMMEARSYHRAKELDGEKIMWVDPWYLANGPNSEIMKKIFEITGTQVHEPVKYAFLTNDSTVV